MADGRWLVADGKDPFIFCRCRAGQTGRLPLRKPCATYAKKETLVSYRRWVISHQASATGHVSSFR